MNTSLLVKNPNPFEKYCKARADFLKQLGVIEYTEKAKKIFPEKVS